MRNVKKISDQRGTLLIEAIAMLGLIAMVTPTLYKKSTERLQEIQDINIASQARTMNSIIETFVRANAMTLSAYTANSDSSTIELCYEDSSGGDCYEVGYSSYIPNGFEPYEIKNFDSAYVFLHNDDGKLVSYIVYPSKLDLGKRRAARLASLVGANGGLAWGSSHNDVRGTGGGWFLDSSMFDEFKNTIKNKLQNGSSALLKENSLVVTLNEPITVEQVDNEDYLYRVPPTGNDAGKYYRNQMVTNLYMGGNLDNTGTSTLAQEYYSIFNVRKLTLNTDCDAANDIHGGRSDENCAAEVADLYVGKPIGRFLQGPGLGGNYTDSSNTGAAWIYGNLSALSDRFRLTHEGYDENMNRNGYDVLEFVRNTTDEVSEEDIKYDVLHADNFNGDALVSMMNGFVNVHEKTPDDLANGDNVEGPAFMVGASSVIGGEGALISAYNNGAINKVYINRNTEEAATYINNTGGWVFINGASSDTDIPGSTYINQSGGLLQAGENAGWLHAAYSGGSAEVYLLADSSFTGDDDRIFAVGDSRLTQDHMIWSDRDKVSLRGGNITTYTLDNAGGMGPYDNNNLGGRLMVADLNSGSDNQYSLSAQLNGATTINTRYTDILGWTYVGQNAMSSNIPNDPIYTRAAWELGVAGSAFIDQFLYANRAWFNKSGFRELHAGFTDWREFDQSSRAGWLNVYDSSIAIRNREAALAHSGTIFNSSDTMLYADSSQLYFGDTKGAWGLMENGSARVGTDDNFFWADSSSANVTASSLATVYTTDTTAGIVDLQKGAMELEGNWTSSASAEYGNKIRARAGEFTIQTRKVADITGSAAAQFYADDKEIHTRYVNFEVQNDSSLARLRVRPNETPEASSGSANVMVNGSFHVTGNEVIHIASNSSNAAGADDENKRAMFEIDPNYISVWAKHDNGNYAGGTDNPNSYYAMLKINPKDVSGGTIDNTTMDDTSIYIRKGAIELQENPSNGAEQGTYAADEGYGYIRANRFVSNVRGLSIPEANGTTKSDRGTAYDQYMVNPAYTSVMHDIKLTTRGGARLSDILPDYVLKGVYNVSNDYNEAMTHRISWSAGTACGKNTVDGTEIRCTNEKVLWASPYMGQIPYAHCPPGYRNLATVMPTSFQIGQAGELLQLTGSNKLYGDTAGKFVVNPYPRQAAILSNTNNGAIDVVYPGMQMVSSLIYNQGYSTGATHGFAPDTWVKTEGWFLGMDAISADSSWASTVSDMSSFTVNTGTTNLAGWKYKKDASDDFHAVAQPLYFQQNTWLKTSLDPFNKGWRAYMGFIYDKTNYNLTAGLGSAGMNSNNTPGNNNEEGSSLEMQYPTDLVWNLFPVPTNTLEGHATVYCYFDRTNFTGSWTQLVDQLDQLHDYHDVTSKNGSDYSKRLNDPTLKYTDPW